MRKQMKMILDREAIEFYAYLYCRDYPKKERDLENRIMRKMERARNRGHLSLNDLKLIGQWKDIRVVHWLSKNPKEDVTNATSGLFLSDVNINEEHLTSLDNLKGVDYPVASTILYFVFPNLYPIIDFRVMEMVGVPIEYRFGKRQDIEYDFSMWKKYVKLCQKTADDYELEVRDVEKALWKCHQVYAGNMKLIMRLPKKKKKKKKKK